MRILSAVNTCDVLSMPNTHTCPETGMYVRTYLHTYVCTYVQNFCCLPDVCVCMCTCTYIHIDHLYGLLVCICMACIYCVIEVGGSNRNFNPCVCSQLSFHVPCLQVDDGPSRSTPNILSSLTKYFWNSSPNTNGNNNNVSIDHNPEVYKEPDDKMVQTVLPEVACLPEESSSEVTYFPGATLFHKTPHSIDGTFKKRRRRKHTLMGDLKKRDQQDLQVNDSDSSDSMSSEDSVTGPFSSVQSDQTVLSPLMTSNHVEGNNFSLHAASLVGRGNNVVCDKYCANGDSEANISLYSEELSTPVCPPKKRKRKSTVSSVCAIQTAMRVRTCMQPYAHV